MKKLSLTAALLAFSAMPALAASATFAVPQLNTSYDLQMVPVAVESPSGFWTQGFVWSGQLKCNTACRFKDKPPPPPPQR